LGTGLTRQAVVGAHIFYRRPDSTEASFTQRSRRRKSWRIERSCLVRSSGRPVARSGVARVRYETAILEIPCRRAPGPLPDHQRPRPTTSPLRPSRPAAGTANHVRAFRRIRRRVREAPARASRILERATARGLRCRARSGNRD
jgi:hypothetical protein